MGSIFGTQKSLKDIIRENQRMLRKAIRELEKEITSLKNAEVRERMLLIFHFFN